MKKTDFPTIKLDQIWRLLGTHGTTECNGKYKHISVIRKNMIAVYYNRITLRKKLYRKSCHSVCAVPQSQISRNTSTCKNMDVRASLIPPIWLLSTMGSGTEAVQQDFFMRWDWCILYWNIFFKFQLWYYYWIQIYTTKYSNLLLIILILVWIICSTFWKGEILMQKWHVTSQFVYCYNTCHTKSVSGVGVLQP